MDWSTKYCKALKNISEPLDVIETNYDAAFNNPPTTTEYDKSYKGDNTTTSDNIGTDVDARYNGLKNIYHSVTPVVGTACNLSSVRFGI